MYQYSYILFSEVGDAQKAIQHLDQSYKFGNTTPLRVEMWTSKQDIENEKKRKEDREQKQFVNSLFQGLIPPHMNQ